MVQQPKRTATTRDIFGPCRYRLDDVIVQVFISVVHVPRKVEAFVRSTLKLIKLSLTSRSFLTTRINIHIDTYTHILSFSFILVIHTPSYISSKSRVVMNSHKCIFSKELLKRSMVKCLFHHVFSFSYSVRIRI